MDPKFSDKYPCKRHTGKYETRENGGRVWSDVAISQRTPTANRSWKRQATESPLDPVLISEFCPPELRIGFYCSKALSLQQFVIAATRN